MSEDLRGSMLERLMFVLMRRGIPDLPDIKNRFQIILDEYKVEPKETAMVVYTEGKNEYFIKRFLLAKAVAGCTSRTIELYRLELTRVFEEIGKDADAVVSLDVQVYLGKKMQQISPITVDNRRRCLSSFYNWLHREELIDKNPMNKVERIKVRKPKKYAFTEMEVEKIRNSCKTARDKAMVEVLLSTGCRASEVVSIKISDIQGDKIEVLGKGEKYRIVYLNAKAQLAISNYLAERKDKNPYLFPAIRDEWTGITSVGKKRYAREWYKNPSLVSENRHMRRDAFCTRVRTIGKHAKVENVHAHRFRRTCATFALRRGMPIEQVSKMLGHEQIDTTQVYLDLSESELAHAHSKYVV